MPKEIHAEKGVVAKGAEAECLRLIRILERSIETVLRESWVDNH